MAHFLRDGDVISLKTIYGKFVSARKDGTVVETFFCKESEHFIIETSKNFIGKIALKTCHGTYLSVHDDTTEVTQAINNTDKERFRPQIINNKVNFFTVHDSYLSCQNGKIGQQKGWLREEDKFILLLVKAKLHPNDKVSLRTYHHTFLSEDLKTTNLTQIPKRNNESVFTVEIQSLDGKFSLKTKNGLYVSANKDGSLELSTVTKESEFFTAEYYESRDLFDQFNSFFGSKFVDVQPKLLSIKSIHGTYLSARKDGTVNFQNWCKTFEQFDIIRN